MTQNRRHTGNLVKQTPPEEGWTTSWGTSFGADVNVTLKQKQVNHGNLVQKAISYHLTSHASFPPL